MTQHDFRSGSKKHTKHKICALLTKTKPPQQNHSIKYHTLSFPNKIFCQNNKNSLIFLSGGKNIGKTALKNQLMDLLRHHVIRHDKVPTFELFLLTKWLFLLIEKYWNSINGEYIDVYIWEEATKVGAKHYEEFIRVFDDTLQMLRIPGGGFTVPINVACLIVFSNGGPGAM